MINLSKTILAYVFVLPVLLAGVLKVSGAGPPSTEIGYPGDEVKYINQGATWGYVLRVVNSSDHDPPVLIAWRHDNYSVSWEHPENLTLISRSQAAELEEDPLDCKQMHANATAYSSYINLKSKIGMQFRSLRGNEDFWIGDMCIYLGMDLGLGSRLWCYRSKKFVFVNDFENLQYMPGVSNYPGVYEYTKNNKLKGFYRYPVLSKYKVTIKSKYVLLGQENKAVLSMDCNNGINVSVVVYTSLANNNINYTKLTNTSIPVPSETNLTTSWTAQHLGSNYIEFVIKESAKNYVKTGIWYQVLQPVAHEVEVQAPGTDSRFVKVDDPITVIHSRTNGTQALLACAFFNGSNGNATQYSIVEDKFLLTNTTYKYRGLHEIFTMVWNKLSFELTELSLVVVEAFEIENLTLAVESKNVKTSETQLRFLMSALKGSSAQCNITYGDDSPVTTYTATLTDFYDEIENETDLDDAIKTDLGFQHFFTKSSPYSTPGFYNVRVVCENAVSYALDCTTIRAHDEITNFSVPSIDPHQFGEPINVMWTMEKGTNVTVNVWYNDILCNTVNVSLTNNQNNSYDCLVSNMTHYDQDNSVDIKLEASNLVSNVTIIVPVVVLLPLVVTNLVALTSTSQWGSGMPGAGPHRNKFPAEYVVWFKANYTGAPATSFYWKDHYPSYVHVCWSCGSLDGYNVERDVEFDADVDTFTMEVVVYNAAGLAAESLSIDIDKSFSITSLIIDDPVLVNLETTLTINLGAIGDHTCVAVDIGVNSSLRLYGELQACDDQYNHSLRTDTVFTEKSSNTTVIPVAHVFASVGRFLVKVSGRNYVSWGDTEKEVVVVLKPCEYPSVTIHGLNETDVGLLPKHWKSEKLNLTREIEIDCDLTNFTQTTWTFFKLEQDPTIPISNPSDIDSIPRTEYQFSISANLSNPELILDSRSLEYGFYAVTARLEMKGHPDLFGEDTKYFQVIATPFLEPAVTTGFMYGVIFREMAILNASATVDPDFEHLDGVTYQWFCRDMEDEVEFGPDYDAEPLLYIPEANDNFAPAETNSTGCFGEGRGRLDSSDQVLKMNSTFMVEGKYFMITLVTTKVDPEGHMRRTAIDIFFQVLLGLPPSLAVNCRKNCQEKVNPDEKIIIESYCQERCYGELAFIWRLFWFDSIDTPEPFRLTDLNQVSSDVLETMVTNPINELQMAFRPNVLVPNRKYILQLTATRPNNVTGELRYTMLMNDVPTGGACSISPPIGLATVTNFNFTCKNWDDPDGPIKFSFSYEINGVRSVFLDHTVNPGESFVLISDLPIGNSKRDNLLDVYVVIEDKYGGATEVYRPVTVDRVHYMILYDNESSFWMFIGREVDPPGDESLTNMENFVSGNSLDSLISGGDPQKALALAGVFASVLDHVDSNNSLSGNLTAEEMARRQQGSQKVDNLKQSIMKSLSGINVTDMNTLLQLSGTTQALTQNTGTLSPTSQELGMQLSFTAVESLTNFSKGESSFKNVNSAVTNLASTLGQLILASSEPREDENFTMSNSSINRVNRSMAMVDDLHEAMQRYLVPNEGPATTSTEHLTLQNEKVSIRNMGKNGNAASNCGFKTPSPEVFGFGDIVENINQTISQLDSVSTKLGVFNKNPFQWDNTSKTVTSKVVSVELTSNKEIQLSNLTEDIAITISRDASQFPKMNSFYMKPDKKDENFKGDLYLKYHCFNRTTRWTAMNFEIYPEDVSLNLKVYLKTGAKPDVRSGDYDLQYDLPDFSSCDVVDADEQNATNKNDTIVLDPYKHCAIHPYSVFVSNVDFNETGEHCFAIQINGSAADIDTDAGNSRRKRSFACDIGKRRMRRSCVIIPPPPPPPPTESPFTVLVADNLGFDGKYFFPNQTPNYNMSMYESSCLFWDEENQTWTGEGCRVGPLTTRTNIQCFCNHLTSFGSDLVVAPNPIDFNSVFNNFGSLQDNVAVLALISTVLGLYILGVLWGRRADKRDKLMVGPTILPSRQGTHHYLVTLYTGNRQGSGTTAKVFFKMAGDNAETIPLKLWDAKRPCFERGQENQFIISYPEDVGELSYVQIWHNNAGLYPSWYLSRLVVKDIQSNKQWYFVCDNWLAVESEDGKVCRVIPVANDQELTNFNQLFTARTVKGLADGHLWFSIFSRPPNSNFTRVQRLSCCLCLLCCTMITSAMFYNMGGDGPSPFAIHIGSLVIDLKQFVIALQSSLIIVPVNVAIVQIFRNLRPKQSKKDKYSEETKTDSEDKESEKEKPKGKLPHWFIYIAYLLCYLASAASIFFTLLYSIQWGKEKSTEWVIAMVTAFLQSVLLLQPVKVLVLAVVFAVFVRKPTDAGEEDDTPVTYEPPIQGTMPISRKKKKKQKIYRPPEPETLREARTKRLKEIKMNAIMKEIAAFFIFLIMLMNVAYYHRDPNTFLITKTLHETFDEVDAWSIDLGAVSDGDSLWMWTRETLVPGLFANEWYNGKKAEKGFIANMEDYLVGVPRIRLVRVEEDSCKVDKLFEDSIPHCYGAFSLASEEDRTFGVSWEPLSTDPARKRRDVQNIPETEEEWLELMSKAIDKWPQSPDRQPKEDTLSQDSSPEDLLPANVLAEPNNNKLPNVRKNKEASRQKRAIDPIASSVTGKNRRKKKRLLSSAKPKVYAIEEQALLPNGKIMSCLERWEYKSTLDLRGFPYWGAISLYSGGGYAANLGYEAVTAYTVISDLHSNGWIDVQSRAAFVEFTVYNANTNLFGIVSAMIEFPSSSAAFTKVQYQAARFYLHLDGAQTVSHVLVIFFMLYFLYREGRLVYKQRWAYFKGFWNWVETILVVSEFLTIVLFLARLYEVDRNLIQLRENPNDYVPFQYAAGADAVLCYVLGILVFFYTLRFLRLLRFNKNFAVLGKTLARISGPISGFCLPFFFAFLAFGLFAFSVFGTELNDYSTFQMTMVTQFSMTLGDFDFEALVMANPLLGPLYFFGFVGMNVFILMNVFLAIINDSYAEVQEEEAETQNEYEILEYISEQIQLKVKGEPKKRRKARKVAPKKPALKPRYVTSQETIKKQSEIDFGGNERIYKELYENLFVDEPPSESTQGRPNQPASRKDDCTSDSEMPYAPGENASKLDSLGEQLESLLAKIHEGESNDTHRLETIENILDEKANDTHYHTILFMEIAE